jgi:hypothetical protein
MPSLIPILCNIPRVQKDTLGCEDSTKVKHCTNHVSYRLHQANRFDCMYGRIREMKLVAVCNPAYELFCEVGAI